MPLLLRLALRSFPRGFRRQFGDGIADMVRTDFERARSRGLLSGLAFVASTTLEVVLDGLSERLAPTWIDPAGTRRPWRWRVMRVLETLTTDLRQAARSLRRTPGFAVVVVTTLTLAIGATTAIFSVVEDVLLEPLPFAHADRLVHIGGSAPGTDQPDEFGVPDELYFEYRESVPALEDLGLYGIGSSTTRAEGQVDQLFVTQATPSFFTTLGARALLGRLPSDGDDGSVVVISHWLWQSWFGSDPDVIGRNYVFAREPRTIIGVMPPEFRFPDERVAFWVPLVLRASDVTPGGFGPRLVARMAPDVDVDTLTAQLAPLARRVHARLGGPAPYARIMERHRPTVVPLRERMVGSVSRPLWILQGAVAIVFLIACANVAGLFAVRAEGRLRDLAVRRALGAGRGALVRLQMTEALLLSAAGGAGGVALAWAAVPALIRAAPEAVAAGFAGAPVPGLAEAGVDGQTLWVAAAMSVLAAVLFGLLPAIHFSGARAIGALSHAGRGVIGRGRYVRDALVVAQTAAALVLLVGSALLVQSYWRLSGIDPGYDKAGIFTFQIAPDREGLSDRASISGFQYDFMDRLAAIAGVESVGFISTLPLDEGAGTGNITTPRLLSSNAEAPLIRVATVGGDYFRTMGIALVRGRQFERADEVREIISNVIISESAAALLFPGEDPIGGQVRPATAGGHNWFTVTGVVEDVVLEDFRRDAREPMVYLPGVSLSPAYVVRSDRPDELAPQVRAVIHDVVPESPMYRIFTMDRLAANTMAGLSFTMLMVSVAAGLALLLGAVGLYGVLSYRVTRRVQEIGVRMALGAEAGAVLRMIVWQGARVALAGIAVGTLAAAGLTTYIETLLFDVDRLETSTFLATAVVMVGVALVASYFPGRRASRLDPVTALRAD